jgi:hypothetical protein
MKDGDDSASVNWLKTAWCWVKINVNSCFMNQQKFWDLLARRLAGTATLRDLYELDKIVYEQPMLQFWLRLVLDLWRNKEAIEKEPEGEQTFVRILREAFERKSSMCSKTQKAKQF